LISIEDSPRKICFKIEAFKSSLNLNEMSKLPSIFSTHFLHFTSQAALPSRTAHHLQNQQASQLKVSLFTILHFNALRSFLLSGFELELRPSGKTFSFMQIFNGL
jgi:hypothetical protein